MKKRMVLMLMSVILLNSCYYAQQVIDDARESNLTDQANKKNGGGAYSNEKYKSEVYEAIKDVAKRPVNNKVQFEKATLILPENTKINEKLGNLVDIKTGYGIQIIFTNEKSSTCAKKKIKNGLSYGIIYNDNITELRLIGQKIEKVNEFVNTCN